MARKKKKAVEGEEPQEGKKKKKRRLNKKRLLLIPIALIIVAALAAVTVLFVLPRFGINLLGKEDKDQLEEPLPKKGVEAYVIGEDTVASLDTVLEEGEGALLAKRTTPEQSTAEEGRQTYIYELNGAAAIINRYLDLLLGSEVGFSLVDENYVIQDGRPELVDAEGGLMVAKNSAVEGRVFQLVIGWSEDNNMLAVRISAPEAQLRKPDKKEEAKPASLSEQLDTIREMEPSRLALSGRTMAEYDIYPIEGFVTVDGILCRRFNIYEAGKSGKLASIIFLSGDQKHVFRMDVNDNTIITDITDTT